MTGESKQAWEDDLFGRHEYADYLTNFIKATPSNRVISLDAAWGSGKTFFVKNWLLQLEQHHPCIYVNAWESDFSLEPLIPILAELNNKIEELLTPEEKITSTLKDKSEQLLSTGKSLIPFIASAFASHYTDHDSIGEIVKAAVEGAPAKKTEIIKQFSARNSLLIEFKQCLSEAIHTITKNGHSLPLFIFIDELDRCRPSYAIELLESVKHVFNSDNVVFIVSTDKTQLSHSIKAVYGQDFDSLSYLNRFFDHQVTLPPPYLENLTLALVTKESEIVSKCTFLPNANERELSKHLSIIAKCFNLELRDQKQCFAKFTSILSQLNEHVIHHVYIYFLIILNFKHPKLFASFISNKDVTKDVQELFINNEASIFFYSEIDIFRFITLYLSHARLTPKELHSRIRGGFYSDDDPLDALLVAIEGEFATINHYTKMVTLSGFVDS